MHRSLPRRCIFIYTYIHTRACVPVYVQKCPAHTYISMYSLRVFGERKRDARHLSPFFCSSFTLAHLGSGAIPAAPAAPQPLATHLPTFPGTNFPPPRSRCWGRSPPPPLPQIRLVSEGGEVRLSLYLSPSLQLSSSPTARGGIKTHRQPLPSRLPPALCGLGGDPPLLTPPKFSLSISPALE